jgi:hypothetical protein
MDCDSPLHTWNTVVNVKVTCATCALLGCCAAYVGNRSGHYQPTVHNIPEERGELHSGGTLKPSLEWALKNMVRKPSSLYRNRRVTSHYHLNKTSKIFYFTPVFPILASLEIFDYNLDQRLSRNVRNSPTVMCNGDTPKEVTSYWHYSTHNDNRVYCDVRIRLGLPSNGTNRLRSFWGRCCGLICAVDFFVKVSVSIWDLTATKCWLHCCCLWFFYQRMLTLSVAVSFHIGMSVDNTSSFERLTDSEDTGRESVYWQGVRSVHKVCESAVCVQVSVNIFDNLIRMVGHHNQLCRDKV